jgi:hypothetical protein
MQYILRQTQLPYILSVLATSFGLGRPSSGQNYMSYLPQTTQLLQALVIKNNTIVNGTP